MLILIDFYEKIFFPSYSCSLIVSWCFWILSWILVEVIKLVNKRETQLLLSFTTSSKEITNSTVSKWIKDNLVLPGWNKFSKFSSHSTPFIANFKVDCSPPCASKIIRRCSWPSESTRKKFHHRDIIINK